MERAQALQESVPVRYAFMLRVFLALLALVLLSLAISAIGKWAGRAISLAGHTEDRTVYEIVIGNDVLAIPANMIRFEASRRNGVASRVDLYLHWPDMDGYSAAARDDFNHADGRRSIIFLSFEPRMMSQDMSGRLEPIYRQLVEEKGHAGPGGLVVRDFKDKTGYVDEVLIVGEREGGPDFVARCLSGEAARQSLAPCERDIQFGGDLSLVYRMPAELAGSWRKVDEAVMEAARRFLLTGK